MILKKQYQPDYDLIYKAAKKGKINDIKEEFKRGALVKVACLFAERFYDDKKTSKIIQDVGTCRCGSTAVKWIPEPICLECGFDKALEIVELK